MRNVSARKVFRSETSQRETSIGAKRPVPLRKCHYSVDWFYVRLNCYAKSRSLIRFNVCAFVHTNRWSAWQWRFVSNMEKYLTISKRKRSFDRLDDDNNQQLDTTDRNVDKTHLTDANVEDTVSKKTWNMIKQKEPGIIYHSGKRRGHGCISTKL